MEERIVDSLFLDTRNPRYVFIDVFLNIFLVDFFYNFNVLRKKVYDSDNRFVSIRSMMDSLISGYRTEKGVIDL